ncbi:MAG: pyridoxal phosphate-dependent aminotransferase [Burkholderiales bacterium]|nr:pyridoxal phosphate-dependent aminotransferase [Burkholderiales bacterium]MBI3730717.1 pyridoxal phosphate-dependent aminotransferase [Burkholderiales bacterium]
MTTTARFVPESKLPEVGTTIFSVMSALAAEKKAVNLGQGFPDFSCDPALPALVAQAMADNYNQYPPMPGMPQLREQIATKIKNIYGHAYDVNTEITVTAGATQGILTILLACVHAGDEVIVIEPAYDSYVSSIKLAGGVPVFVSMELGANGYTIPWDKVKASITDKTRLLMLNSPHNPTGSVLSVDDIAALTDIVRDSKVLIASDEVYEHMVFDGERHESLSRYPELAERSFIISSFGKTYHVTGWKVGYVTAPAALMAEFRKVHQYNVFTVNTPMQVGLAQYMNNPAPYLELPDFYQKKRDLFRAGLANSRLRLLPCAGTYFQSVDYSAVSDMTELDFSRWLTTEIGVAAIPVSAFYQQGKESGIVRFCFAKQDGTLQDALQRLQSI